MCKILLIGEAWGEREERWKHALVGPSGAELARMLAQAEIGPELGMKYPSELDMIRYWRDLRNEQEIDITNVFSFRPPNNNIAECFESLKEGGMAELPALRMGKYLKPELLHHVEKLWKEITEKKPNLVVAMGNTACWAVLGQASIGTLRGTFKISPRLGVKVMPTYHPAAVLRQWNLRTIVISDLGKVKNGSAATHIERVQRWVTVEPSVAEIADWVTRPAEYYAVDIETNKVGISMIGFARSAQDALVIPFYDDRKDREANYWSPEDEKRAWHYVKFLLERPVPKVFQNGVYDLFHLLRAGLRPTMCDHDTMILHHSLYPEMLKGLGFLGSIYSREIAWKPMRKKGNNLKRDE